MTVVTKKKKRRVKSKKKQIVTDAAKGTLRAQPLGKRPPCSVLNGF